MRLQKCDVGTLLLNHTYPWNLAFLCIAKAATRNLNHEAWSFILNPCPTFLDFLPPVIWFQLVLSLLSMGAFPSHSVLVVPLPAVSFTISFIFVISLSQGPHSVPDLWKSVLIRNLWWERMGFSHHFFLSSSRIDKILWQICIMNNRHYYFLIDHDNQGRM